jgi:multidrug efflux system outer membrane protein
MTSPNRTSRRVNLQHAGIALLATLLMCGCTLGPDYRRPALDIPGGWRLGETQANEISDVAWWDQFQDPVLSHLVRTALENNLDLKIATSNVEQAYAQYGIVRSQQFPEVNLDASATRQKTILPPPLNEQTYNTFALDLSAGFELDVWGRLRRATEAARASLLSTEEGRRTVVLTLVASVANGYIQLRALDKQFEIAKRTLETRREVLKLQKLRYEGGVAPESDYQQAESQLRQASSQLLDLERQISRQENFISVLLGQNPHAIVRGRALDDLQFPAVPAGLPSDLLVRRPDIRQAEQDLIAANADIGVARAAYFPIISLTGILGVQSAELSDLFKSSARTWALSGGLTQSVFNAGRIRNQVERAEAAQRGATYNYRRSVINAFEDAENALIDRTKYAQIREERAADVAALQRFQALADLRYREGVTIFLEVANAQTQLFEAELELTATQSQLFQAYSNLYRALGGGWVGQAEALSQAPRQSSSTAPKPAPTSIRQP